MTGRALCEGDIPLVVAEPERLLFLSDAVPLTKAAELFSEEQVAAMVKALDKGLSIYRTGEVAAVYRRIVGPHGYVAISVDKADVCYPLGLSDD